MAAEHRSPQKAQHPGAADARKAALRRQAWEAMTRAGVARFPGAAGRIPNFTGAEACARLLAELPEWQAARTVKANPDAPQRAIRRLALDDGKTVFMAVPRLREPAPFIRLDPALLQGKHHEASSIKGAFALGQPVRLDDMPPIDIVVCGSVAVNRGGARLGKGGGYSDLEFALLAERGRISDRTVILTTVHPIQVLGDLLLGDGEDDIPMLAHDFPLDLIVTPREVIRIERRRRGGHPRPRGIIPDILPEEKRQAIPVLRELFGQRRNA